MKIALLGNGKTGSHVLSLAQNEPATSATVFNRGNPPERNALAGHDIAISFFPGDAFLRYIPELIASRVPVVTGSTGFEWPEGRDAFSDRLRQEGLVWVHANNFSLGMNLMREMIRILSKSGELYEDCRFSLHEVHHTRKKDAPSGTALSWKQWLGHPVDITSERTGDVIGEHALTLDTPFERIAISHSALDRRIFASGALWTARQVLHGAIDDPGLHDMQQLALQRIRNSTENHHNLENTR